MPWLKSCAGIPLAKRDRHKALVIGATLAFRPAVSEGERKPEA